MSMHVRAWVHKDMFPSNRNRKAGPDWDSVAHTQLFRSIHPNKKSFTTYLCIYFCLRHNTVELNWIYLCSSLNCRICWTFFFFPICTSFNISASILVWTFTLTKYMDVWLTDHKWNYVNLRPTVGTAWISEADFSKPQQESKTVFLSLYC